MLQEATAAVLSPESVTTCNPWAVLELVFRENAVALYRAARDIVGPGGDPEGVISASIIKAREKWHQFDQRGDPYAWVRRIVQNTARDDVRAARRSKRVAGVDVDAIVRSCSVFDFDAEDARELVHRTLAVSPAGERRFVQAVLGGLSGPEACRAIGTNARRTTHIMRQFLKRVIRTCAKPGWVEFNLAFFDVRQRACVCRMQKMRAAAANDDQRLLVAALELHGSTEVLRLADRFFDEPIDTPEREQAFISFVFLAAMRNLICFQRLGEWSRYRSQDAERNLRCLITGLFAILETWAELGWGDSDAHIQRAKDLVSSNLADEIITWFKGCKFTCEKGCKSLTIVSPEGERISENTNWKLPPRFLSELRVFRL